MPKTLTKEDFEKGGDPNKEDTSAKETLADEKPVRADAKVIIDGDKETIVEPDDKEAPEEEAKVTDDENEPPPKPSDFKAKHKTWEETEKARIELEKGFHSKASENAELRRRLEQFEKPASSKKEPTTIDEKVEALADEALVNIRNLKVDYGTDGKETRESVERREREAAVIWGRYNRKVARLEFEETNRTQRSESETASKLYKAAQTAELKSDDELDMVGVAFSRTDPGLPVEDRIDAAVATVRDRINRIREGFVKKQERDKKEKDDLKVLGGGSRSRPAGSEKNKSDKPDTMSQQLSDIKEKRTLSRDSL